MRYTVISWVPGVLSFIVPKFAGLILLARLLNPGRIHRIFMWIASVFYILLTLPLAFVLFIIWLVVLLIHRGVFRRRVAA